ncbi:hypothetical protein GCM10023259_045310 [Thermocatellispora tengchongensis]
MAHWTSCARRASSMNDLASDRTFKRLVDHSNPREAQRVAACARRPDVPWARPPPAGSRRSWPSGGRGSPPSRTRSRPWPTWCRGRPRHYPENRWEAPREVGGEAALLSARHDRGLARTRPSPPIRPRLRAALVTIAAG